MFKLERENFTFYRVKHGQEISAVSRELSLPPAVLYSGSIAEVKGYEVHIARVGESYETIARLYGADAEDIRKCNGDAPVYPTKKIYVRRGS